MKRSPLRYVTGAIEVGSALALLVPSLAPFGALLLIPTMVAAIATHLFIIGGAPAPAIVLLMGSIAIAWPAATSSPALWRNSVKSAHNSPAALSGCGCTTGGLVGI